MFAKNMLNGGSRIVVVLLVLLLLFSNTPQGLVQNGTSVWSPMLLLSENNDGRSSGPVITTDSKDNIFVAWFDNTDYIDSGSDYDGFFRYYNSTLETWSEVEVFTLTSDAASYSPDIGVDSEDNVYITWRDHSNIVSSGSDADIFLRYRNGTNGLWSNTILVSDESYSYSWDPSLVVDKNDNVHIVWHDGSNIYDSGTDYDIYLKSFNFITSNHSELQLVSTESTGTSLYPDIAVDNNNNIHVLWFDETDYNGSGIDFDIFYKYHNSSDNSWSPAWVVSGESNDRSDSVIIEIDSNNTVHVVWLERFSDIKYRSWKNENEFLLSQSKTLGPAGAVYPELSIDSQDNLHFSFTDYYVVDGKSKRDVFYQVQDSINANWSAPIAISNFNNHDVGAPNIAFSSQDSVHVVWKAQENSTNSMFDYDIYYRTKDVSIPFISSTTTEIPPTTDTASDTSTLELPIQILPILSALIFSEISVRYFTKRKKMIN